MSKPFYVITFYDPKTEHCVYSMDDQGEIFHCLDAAKRFAAVLGGEGTLVTLWDGQPEETIARIEITEHA